MEGETRTFISALVEQVCWESSKASRPGKALVYLLLVQKSWMNVRVRMTISP